MRGASASWGPIDPDKLYDVVVIGAGPSGLATSVYAGSEGLSVLTIDCRSFGGQAGASARIENYLGFPTGISGMALMGRAFSQAQKFGVEIAIPDEAVQAGMRKRPVPHRARHRRAGPGTVGRDCHRSALPKARGRSAGRVRRDVGPLLGIAAGSRSRGQRGRGAGRRRQFRRAGRRLPREPRAKGDARCQTSAQPQPCRNISSIASRACRTWKSSSAARSARCMESQAPSTRSPFASARLAGTSSAAPASFSASSARSRTLTGCRAPDSSWTSAGSC